MSDGRGGYREGAGRKRADGVGRIVRVMINLTPAEAEALDAVRGPATRGEVARILMLRGMGTEDEE